nr:discoidin domain-containing protein [uncultured Allomuricauda sp.]
MKKTITSLFILIAFTVSAQQPETDWLAGEWGITFPVYGGGKLNAEMNSNNPDYVSGAQEIVDELPAVGHVITNMTNFANAQWFTLSANANVDVANEIHSTMVPNAANDEIIFDVLQTFKDGDKKVILYISCQLTFERATTAIQDAWVAYYTNNFGGDRYAAYRDLIQGFILNVKDYADGYWLDTVGNLSTDGPDFVAMIKAADPGAIVAVNANKKYITLDGSEIQVDSDGTNDDDPSNYKVVVHEPRTNTQDFSHGHVSPVGVAPTNSWAYEEFTIPNMVENPYFTLFDRARLKHAWFPTRERWHLPDRFLLYDTEQAYRFVRRITDAGASVTWATTTDPGPLDPDAAEWGYETAGHMMPDEMAIMKEINNRMLMSTKPDYVPYVRPAGAFLVGETAPNYYQHIDFQSLKDKQVGDADFSPKATASSGLSVTYTSSNTSVATIVNGNIRIQGEGTTNITASQGGNSTFAAASSVVRQLTVTSGGTGGTTNLAHNAPATQSTTLGDAVASRANDGDTNGNFGGDSVSAAGGPNAWWEVDLEGNYSIDDIVIFNRTNNCCKARLSDFTVSVIDSNGTTTFTQTITTAPNPSITLDAGGAIGQVVRIQSNLTETLNLAEVEVYGSESSKLDQTITFNLPAKQLGDADFDPATASSGYNISYTSSNTNVATIVNGNIRIVGVGTSEITASQAGNVIYNPAPSITRTLVVTDGNTGGSTNLAYNAPATQSTTLGDAVASRANDGDTNGNFGGDSVSAAGGPNAWWEVDLEGNYSIDDIVIFNRTNNCCKARLSDFTVSVIDSSGTTTFTQTITTAPNPSVTLNAGGAIGEVVRIQSNLTETLNLAEVEVYGSQSNTNNTITIQENATGFCDVDGVIQSADAGYTGSGYANTSNALGRAIDWEIDGTAGSYTFVWRYLVGSARTADLIVDGTTVATGISFVNTQGGWLTAEATVGLGAGVKSVILSSTSSTGLAKIDYLEVTGPDVVVSECVTSSPLRAILDLKAPDTDTEDILHFYPNPTTDILNVEINGSNDAQLDIINSTGQNVISKHMENGSTSVDMTRLPLGLYILKVTDEKQIRTKKIIKK